MYKIDPQFLKVVNKKLKNEYDNTQVIDVEYVRGVFLWDENKEDERIYKTNVTIKTESDLQDDDLMKIIFTIGDTGKLVCNEDIMNLPLSINIDFTFID